MKKAIILILITLNLKSFAQNFQWARNFGGDKARCVTLDDSGNVYTLGTYQGTVDADPGPRTFNLSGYGRFLAKLDASGNFKWAVNVAGDFFTTAFVVGHSGCIYITGRFSGKQDFDPGSATYNLLSEGGEDIYLTKLGPSGKFLWAKRIGGKDREEGCSIGLDNFENIHITGYYSGLVDFDPGSPTYKLTAWYYDIFVAKFDSSGSFIWVKSFGRGYQNSGLSIFVDQPGNVYITGYFGRYIEFNSGTTNISMYSRGSYDTYVLKLDSNGNVIWAKNFGGPLDEIGFSIGVDRLGYVYTSGYFEDSADFDPGKGTYYLGANRSLDIFISKLDSSGDFVWAKRIGGISKDIGSSLALDDSANIYLTGYFEDSVDFDPGQGIKYLFGDMPKSIFTAKFSTTGNLAWAKKTGGYIDYPFFNSISVDKKMNVYTTGSFWDSTDFDPDEPSSFLNSLSGSIYVSKLGPCPSPLGAIKGEILLCSASGKTSYKISHASGATGYFWKVPPGMTIDSGQNTNTIHVSFGKSSGKITVVATNSCDTNSFSSLFVKTGTPPKVGIIASPSIIVCEGTTLKLSGTGASKYTWTGGVKNGIDFKPFISQKYIIEGTDSIGCMGKDSVITSVIPLPSILIHPSDKQTKEGSIVQFTVISNDTNISYQWQQNTGMAFSDLSNIGQYSGVNTATLTITKVSLLQTKYKFRVVLSRKQCSSYSNSAILNVLTSGISNINTIDDLEIYPNPANTVIAVQSMYLGMCDLEILNSLGQTVFHKNNVEFYENISISNLKDGVYTVVLKSGNRQSMMKLIKTSL